MLSLCGFGTASVEGSVQSRQLSLVALPGSLSLSSARNCTDASGSHSVSPSRRSFPNKLVRVPKPFGWACVAFLDPVAASRAHFPTVALALTRTRSRDASIFIRDPACARDHFNADTFNATEPARPEIVVQNPGRVLGNGDFWTARPHVSSGN